MRVGTLCYATDSGLGILAKSFYDHGVVTDALVLRHHHHITHKDWYPDSDVVELRPFNVEAARRFCDKMDVMLFLETPFDWSLLDFCRKAGVKTVIMPMYECMPREIPVQPDAYFCPSEIDYDWGAKQHNPSATVRIYPINVPVEVPWRQRERAEVFVHNAGHGGLKGRNGTAEVIEAIKYVKSQAHFIIRSQANNLGNLASDRVTQGVGDLPYSQLYLSGDVFLFPEHFNGLSLPLQEARAAGMLVMATDRYPINTWLPNSVIVRNAEGFGEGAFIPLNPLIKPVNTVKNCISPRMVPFDEAIHDPRIIAAKIDEWYGRDITEYSKTGREWAATMSWDILGPKYKEALEDL